VVAIEATHEARLNSYSKGPARSWLVV